MLCGLGATAFASWVDRGWRTRLGFLGGFLIAVLGFGADRFPQPGWIAITVAIVAALTLWKPAWSVAMVVCGGLLAGLWISVLQLQGLPFVPALVVGVAMPAVSAFFSMRRPDFATQTLREESLILLIVLGLAVAMVPEVTAGWRSALELKAVPLGVESPDGVAWVFLVGGACALFGGMYSLWRRR